MYNYIVLDVNMKKKLKVGEESEGVSKWCNEQTDSTVTSLCTHIKLDIFRPLR